MCEPLWTAVPLVGIWVAVFAAAAGLGLGVRRLFGLGAPGADGVFLAFWTGWAGCLTFLTVWHLFRPVDAAALGGVVLLGSLGLAAARKDAAAVLGKLRARPLLLALWLLVALWAASRALGPLRHFDTSFYHLTTLEWLKAYPVVPGLGNLHGRLAFNNSPTLFAAALDAVWPGQALRLANSLLLFVVLTQGAWSTWQVFSSAEEESAKRRAVRLFRALLAVPVLALFFGELVPSLSTDTPVFVLSLVTAAELLSLLCSRHWSPARKRYRLFALAVLVAAGLTVKLSLAVSGALTLAVAFAVVGRRGLLRAAAAGAVILGPWMVHGVYLSGHLAFPVAATAVPVAWRVPRPLVLDEAGWIYGLARKTTTHWAEVVDDWSWFENWLDELPPSVTRPVLLTALALLAVAAVMLCGGARRLRDRAWLVLLPTAVSLLWWFLTAPKPRFAGAGFAVLAAGLAVLGISRGSFRIRGRTIDRAVVLWLVFFAVLATPNLLGGDAEADDGPYCTPPPVEYAPWAAAGGLRVHVPARGIQCSTLPLPCTPYHRPNLKLRVPGDLGSGFVLEKTMTLANLEEAVPVGFWMPPEIGVSLVSGWRKLEFSGGVRTMGARARLFLYTERPAAVLLRLRPRAVTVSSEEVERGELRILLKGREAAGFEVRPGVPREVELALGRDWNDVVLELSVDEELGPPANELTGRRPLALAFDGIEIARIPP